MTSFPIIDVQSEIEVDEQLGTKEKYWFNYENKLHLLKFGREGTGENWAEKVACELCGLLELPHAHYELAHFRGRMGVLTPKMNPEGSRLVLGNELIDTTAKNPDGTRFYKYRGHTVNRVIAALKRFTDDPNVAINNFIGYLLLDAWIGNGDRHNENWGLVNDPERESITWHPRSIMRRAWDANCKMRFELNECQPAISGSASKLMLQKHAQGFMRNNQIVSRFTRSMHLTLLDPLGSRI